MVSYGLPLSEVCRMFCISLQRNFSVYLQATWVRNVNLLYVNFLLESDGMQLVYPGVNQYQLLLIKHTNLW